MADLQTFDLILFAGGTFAATLVTGVAGFAFGIVVAAVWLHFLSPAHTTALIVAYGLIIQGISVWKLHRLLKLARLLPFLLGAVIGVPNRCGAAALDFSRDLAYFDRHRADPFQPL